MRSYLFAFIALCAGLASAAATPEETDNTDAGNTFYPEELAIPDDELGQWFGEGSDLPEPEEVYGPFGPDDDRWDDDEVVAVANGTAIEARDKSNFRLFRRLPNYNTRLPMYKRDLDEVRIHTDCNGGGCGGELWINYDAEKHLCDKRFKVCGTTYMIKYSGKRPSCARMKYITKANHGERYGKLVHDGKTKAICYFDRSREYDKYCGLFNSLVKCVFT